MNIIKNLQISLEKAEGFLYNKNTSPLTLAIKNLLSVYDVPYTQTNQEQSFTIQDNFQIVTSIPKDIWTKLPITSHEIITPNKKFINDLNKALAILKSIPEWISLKKYLGGICLLQLKTVCKNQDTEITSLSIPVFPFIAFISKKVLIHTPPINIKKPSVIYLAENLLHEATHQAVNLNLIEKNILQNNYDSKNSPLIPIPWRINQLIKRNQKWQIDRTLHATCVYLIIISFRKRMLEKKMSEYSLDDIKSAFKNTHYLITELNKHKNLFKDHTILNILTEDISKIKV